jgi:hypothetical protein
MVAKGMKLWKIEGYWVDRRVSICGKAFDDKETVKIHGHKAGINRR